MRPRSIFAALLSGCLLGVSQAPASTGLCQTLHQTVQPALAGVMKNDNLIEEANRAFTAGVVETTTLRSITEALTHNLNSVSQLLGQKLPPDENPATLASEELMTSRLEAVVTAQNDALNLIEGYAQVEENAREQGDTQIDSARTTPSDFHNYKDAARPLIDTRVGSPSRMLEIERSQIGSLEDNAGIAIMSAVKVCNSP